MSDSKLEAMRHSCEHVLTMAMLRLWPGKVKAAMGPATEEGFYFDFDSDEKISEDDFGKIEKEMAKIIQEDLQIIKDEMTADDASEFFSNNTYKGNEYKHEWIDDIKARNEKVSVYWMGEKGEDIPRTFVDICSGPHVDSTGQIGPFKLLKIAGAYWHGDEKNKMLTRIYGTAFNTQQELDDYLMKLEEAKKRDHRKIGKEQELFILDPEVGLGLPIWLPKGATIWRVIEDYWYKEHLKHGYELVRSPHIGNIDLWNTSGHTQFYKDDMYQPIEVDDERYLLKPMNCPFHVKLYKSHQHSYRELPIRWAECATVYRYEKSGQLSGLSRVRGFTQDDAHIICRKDQVKEELSKVVEFIKEYFNKFGLNEYKVYLSLRDPENKEKYAGDDPGWEFTQGVLKEIAEESGMEYETEEGEAAFYGPKLDFKVKDVLGREWQCPTLQFDFNLPERFDMTYVNEKGEEERPYMLHRTIMGSFERFMAVLIEHYAGIWPLWLAPVQLRLISVGEKHIEFSNQLAEELRVEGVRVEVDASDETVGNKIRKSAKEKIPWTIVLGDKEVGGESFKVRVFGQEDELVTTREGLVDRLLSESEPCRIK
ncbi:MAG: threonine--tRNA ligase [Candidatus Uhrbacteria bacterium]